MGAQELLSIDKISSIADSLLEMSDDELIRTQFAVPWQYSPTSSTRDADGFDQVPYPSVKKPINRKELQAECWNKAIENPQINTSVRGTTGRMTGFGFSVTCPIYKIQLAIDQIELDFRNRLYTYYGKYAARALIEGELFLSLTPHEDGFVEVDFVDPSTVNGKGDDTDGIIVHPNKPTMPLFYCIDRGTSGGGGYDLVPSVYIARNPQLASFAKQNTLHNSDAVKGSKTTKKAFKVFGGYNRFIVAWDRSFITTRNVGHLRTTLEWLNYYEDLKRYEIDHKKSSGAYLWVVKITDPKVFRLWLSLSEEDRRKTGIAAKKVPGSTLVLPFGMEIEAKNPQLPKISDSDTDVLDMAISGLNESSDVTMGTSRSSYSSVKAGRGPMSDRTSDEIGLFDMFLRYDFWGNIFFLKSKMDPSFPEIFKVKEAVDFKKTKKKSINPMTGESEEEDDYEPVFEETPYTPERLIEINYPTSEIVDIEGRSRAYLGVKHGSTYDVLGIPNQEIAKRLGFGNYHKLRLKHATEKDKYPPLIENINQESFQEKSQSEPGPSKVKNNPAGKKPDAEKPAAKPAAKSAK